MKLVWSPERASLAYIDTVQSCQLHRESGVAEFVSATAAGWNAQFILETYSHGGASATSIGLAVAARHTGGRHVCIVPDERSRAEYLEAVVGRAPGKAPEVVVGEADDHLGSLAGVDFVVVDCGRRDFSRVLRLARLSCGGAVLVCKNASLRAGGSFRWRSVLEGRSRRLVRSLFLPVGNGLDIAHVGSGSGKGKDKGKGESRWIKHVDHRSGEEHVIRKWIAEVN